MKDLQLYIFSGAQPIHGLEDEWNKTYKTWKAVWQDAYKELGVDKKVYSDEFTRTPDVLSLFDGDKCLLVLFFRQDDFRKITAAEDSYFCSWTSEALEKLTQYSPHVAVCSNVTVGFDFRGTYRGLRLKDLIVFLANNYLLESACSSLSGTTRNNRGVNRSAYGAGWDLLGGPVPMHGVEVDLVGFFKSRVASLEFEGDAKVYDELAKNLWSNRIDHKNSQALGKLRAA